MGLNYVVRWHSLCNGHSDWVAAGNQKGDLAHARFADKPSDAPARGIMKTGTKIRLLVMNKTKKEKRLDELNQKLGVSQPNKFPEYDKDEMEERAWLKKKLGYGRH